MRSGKSRACIDVACRQYRRGRIEGVVVVAPNGVHLNWARREIPTWSHEGVDWRSFVWETQKRGFPEKDREWTAMMAGKSLRYFCVNMDALKHLDCRRFMKAFIKRCNGNFGLIISEAHHFGRAGAKRTFFARSLAYHANFIRIETGTPILTGRLRAFSIYEMLAPGALGFGSYTKFARHFAVFEKRNVPGRARTYDKPVKYVNLDELRESIGGWSSLVLRSDLHDMPELIRTERPVVMSDLQRRTYLEMVSRHLAEIGDEEVTAKEGGARMQKLQQIADGWLRDTATGKVHTIDPEAPIYAAAIDEIRGTLPGKTLVWCRFKEDIARLGATLKKHRMKYVEYHGDVPGGATAREANRVAFNADESIHCLLGTPDSGGEGLDFSGADCVLFFSGNPNARLIAQAEERATVKGGKSVAVVRLRTYGTVDDRIWEIVDGNISLADTITGQGLRDLLMQTDV